MLCIPRWEIKIPTLSRKARGGWGTQPLAKCAKDAAPAVFPNPGKSWDVGGFEKCAIPNETLLLRARCTR